MGKGSRSLKMRRKDGQRGKKRRALAKVAPKKGRSKKSSR